MMLPARRMTKSRECSPWDIPEGRSSMSLRPTAILMRVRFTESKLKGNQFDFSFSGIKTAVLYHLRRNPQLHPDVEARHHSLARGERGADALRAISTPATLDLVASFQRSVVENLVSRTFAAAEQYSAKTVLVSGGVAANSELRRTFEVRSSPPRHENVLSQPRAFNRQCRDDCSRRLPAISCRRA